MKYTILILLFCLKISYGQETKSILTFKPEFSLYAIVPNNFGDNYLSKANKTDIGLGVNFNFIEVKHFQLGIGYDYISYSITDITRAGNIENSKYNSFYGLLGYQIKLSNKFNLQPYLGLGSVKLNFKSGNRNFGHQTGNDFRIGFNTNYKLAKTVLAFAGVGYVSSNYDIKTNPEFVSFYNNSKMFQINIGIKIN